jgi:hypothetical protein
MTAFQRWEGGGERNRERENERERDVPENAQILYKERPRADF